MLNVPNSSLVKVNGEDLPAPKNPPTSVAQSGMTAEQAATSGIASTRNAVIMLLEVIPLQHHDQARLLEDVLKAAYQTVHLPHQER